MRDPYEALGVERTAGIDDIKRVYRRLVRECHPDLHPGAAAERRFKEVSEAYSILSDPHQRALFDEFGADSFQPGFDAHAARHWRTDSRTTGQDPRQPSPFGDMSAFQDAFSAIFDDAPPRESQRRGTDQRVQVSIEPLLAITGGMTSVSVPRADGRPESVRVRIRPGAQTGDVIPVQGMGNGGRGSLPGDLLVEIDVPEHPLLRRNGDDLEMDVPVTLMEAISGGPITVPTPVGLSRVQLPPNCAGTKLRLRGRGVQRPDRPGHLVLVLRLVLPDQVDATVLEACRTIERAYMGDVRDRIRL